MAAYFDLLFRWYVCIYISIYGTAKLFGAQFGLSEELMKIPVGELTSFQLTWAFFGHSYVYGCIIGASQVLGGLLLLHPRTKLIGVAILLPILSNIIMVDVFYEVNRGALINAIAYLLMLFYILYYERERIGNILKMMTSTDQVLNWEFKNLLIKGLSIAVGAAVISFILLSI